MKAAIELTGAVLLALVAGTAALQLSAQMQQQVQQQVQQQPQMQPNYGYVFPSFADQRQQPAAAPLDQNTPTWTPTESGERSRRDATTGSSGGGGGNSTAQKKKSNNKKKKQKSFETDCLQAHNKWRALHGVGKLEFDRKVS